MTPERAAEFAEGLYDGHPAALPLLLESQNPTVSEETRRRARFALLCLDPMMPLPARWPSAIDPLARWRGGPLDGPARAIVDLLLETFYSTASGPRRRAARLLADLCAEATAIRTAAVEGAA